MSTPPSTLPLNPIPPRLQLARMSSLSNADKLASVIQVEDEEKENMDSKPPINPTAKHLIQLLKSAGDDLVWCWEAWEDFCALGEPWSHSESPFSEPSSVSPTVFPAQLLPNPPSLSQPPSSLSHLLHTFSATTLESVAGSTCASTVMNRHRAKSPWDSIARQSTSGSNVTMPSSPPTESPVASPAASAGAPPPRRKLSPLPYASPSVKAAATGYSVSPPPSINPPANGEGFFSTPLAGVGAGHSAVNDRTKLDAPGRVGKRLGVKPTMPPSDSYSPGGNISFPDLSFYRASSKGGPERYVLPGLQATPSDSHSGHAHLAHLPSIASQLFPHAKDTGHGIGLGIKQIDGLNVGDVDGDEPPVAKRPRSRGSQGTRGGRVKGKVGNDKRALGPTRRSARIQDLSTQQFDHTTDEHVQPPLSPETSSGIASSSPPPVSRPHANSRFHEQVDLQATQQLAADAWLMTLVRRCAAVWYELSRYECGKAIELVDTLPDQIQQGVWALSVYGRACYELAEYESVSCPPMNHYRRLI